MSVQFAIIIADGLDAFALRGDEPRHNDGESSTLSARMLVLKHFFRLR
jgi:hypothetical protein